MSYSHQTNCINMFIINTSYIMQESSIIIRERIYVQIMNNSTKLLSNIFFIPLNFFTNIVYLLKNFIILVL